MSGRVRRNVLHGREDRSRSSSNGSRERRPMSSAGSKDFGSGQANRHKVGQSISIGATLRCLAADRSVPLFLSVFDLFKIGIGPSSSHTMGPMTAAARFLTKSLGDDWPRPTGAKVGRIGCSLHGSLAFTGIGHGTDRAVILGLPGNARDGRSRHLPMGSSRT